MSSDKGTDKPLKVLVVEDEPLLALDLEAQLVQMGHVVIGMAPDSQAAFGLAEKARPDLALVDLNLRDGLTGPQIASELSRDGEVMVAFVTGSPHQIPPDYAGAACAITKPWSPKALEQVISLARMPRRDRAGLPAADLSLVRLAPSFQLGGNPRGKGK